MEHTKEPWAVSGTEIVCASDESHIAEVPHGGSPEQDTADRNRIVACVNACAGMADPATEIAKLREDLAEAVGALEAYKKHMADGQRLVVRYLVPAVDPKSIEASEFINRMIEHFDGPEQRRIETLAKIKGE